MSLCGDETLLSGHVTSSLPSTKVFYTVVTAVVGEATEVPTTTLTPLRKLHNVFVVVEKLVERPRLRVHSTVSLVEELVNMADASRVVPLGGALPPSWVCFP